MALLTSLAIEKSRPARVLVCDDSMLNCRLVKNTLEKRGCRVDTVTSAEEALDLNARDSYDLVLMDVEMPGMSGIEYLRAVRDRMAEQVYLPIVLLTAKTDQTSRLEGLEAGATDFITKPFDPSELTARIHNHIAAKRVHDSLMVTNEQLQRERARVSEIQQQLLPRAMPRVEGFRFAASYLPSSLAGGDYYDVIVRPEGPILLAIGDVSGHGIPSAMYMSILRATLHAHVSAGNDIETIMERLNTVLRHALDDFTFVTFYLAEIDPATGAVEHCSAGHHEPIVIDLPAGTTTQLPVEGTLPLGVQDSLDIKSSAARLTENQRLLIYTDGLTEEQDSDGEMFGLEGLLRACSETASLEPEVACDRILQALTKFAGGSSPRDDVTLLAMDVRGFARDADRWAGL